MNCGFTSLETEAKAKMDEDDCQHEPKSSNNEENEDAQHCGEHFQSSFLARLVFSSEFLSEVVCFTNFYYYMLLLHIGGGT